MKLFDYKFLILLGLTLVVYFIYREILDLKSKVSSIETKVNEVEMKGISDKTSKKSIENKKKPIDNNDKLEKQFSLQIPLPPPPKLSPIEEKLEIPQLVHNENDDSDSELIISNSGEHLEIYSNDNSKTLSFSIGESSDINSDLLDEIEEDSNNNIDLNLNLEEKVDEELKKKTLLVKSERDDDEQLNESDLDIKSPKKDFMKLKLSELQCIAEENNINIKKDKGKKKNKSELSKELTEYFSNSNSGSIQETSN